MLLLRIQTVLWRQCSMFSFKVGGRDPVKLIYSFIIVEVRLHEPLWKVQFSPEDVALELLTLCSQLEVLCKKDYTVDKFCFSLYCSAYLMLIKF